MIDFKAHREASLGYRVARLYRLNSCILDKWLSGMNICSGQIPYIIATNEKPGQTQDELAALIHVNRAATARTLKTMEQSGLVTRKSNPANRRQKLVYPTAESQRIADGMMRILEQHRESLFQGFSEAEQGMVLKLLDRAIRNMECAVQKEGRE